jgi:hypothetical protein
VTDALQSAFKGRQQTTHARMRLTAAKAGEKRIMKSPSPVAAWCDGKEGACHRGVKRWNAPAAPPTELSQYAPEPTMGESPTRPGTLCDAPFVVVPQEMLPLA